MRFARDGRVPPPQIRTCSDGNETRLVSNSLRLTDTWMKVSVLLTTYNHEKWIAQAIESTLMQQTNFDYEVVIMEDRSTDSTRDIVVDFQRRYPDRIRLILSEKN